MEHRLGGRESLRWAGWAVVFFTLLLGVGACGKSPEAGRPPVAATVASEQPAGVGLPAITICKDSRWEITHPSDDSAIYRCSSEVSPSDWQSAVRTTAPTPFASDRLGRGLLTLAFVVDSMGGEIRWNDPAPGQDITAALMTFSGVEAALGTTWPIAPWRLTGYASSASVGTMGCPLQGPAVPWARG